MNADGTQIFLEVDLKLTTDEITEKIIGASYSVSGILGSGFLEKVYENALCVELKNCGLKVSSQVPLNVMYKGVCVGEYFADLFVEDEVIVELKSVSQIASIHKSQLLNYLKATNKKVGLLINFGSPKITINRIVNGYKN